jgi:photosystem II stability/assembly factor-like uncharacterized protein
MTTLLVGSTTGLVALHEQPFGWEVWERTDEDWWHQRLYASIASADGTVLLISTATELRRSTDNGTSWTVVLPHLVRTLANDPHTTGRIYAGTQPAGIWRSDDDGATWTTLPLPGTAAEQADWHLPGDSPLEMIPVARVVTLAPDPQVIDRLYAGIEIGGIWCSDNAGQRWQARQTGLPTLAIHHLVPHPLEPETFFVATDTGVYRSIDGGATWEDRGFAAGAGYTRALLILPPTNASEAPLLLAAPAEVDPWGWDDTPEGAICTLYRSTDEGATWEPLGSQHGLAASFPALISTLSADPNDPAAVWLGTWDGRVYRSLNRGDDWQQVAEELGDIWCLLPLPE